MKVSKMAAVVIGLSFVAACSDNGPGCSDPETLKLVKEISTDTFTEQLKQMGKEYAFTVALKGMRTTDKNAKTGAKSCAADLVTDVNGNKVNTPITYTVEVTDRGDQIYVSVYGLD